MPGLTRTSVGSGDQRWLASAHGINNARSSALDVSAFTEATHYPDGYFPSGLEVNAADESAVTPWTGAEGEQLGYVLFDVSVTGDEHENAAVLRHGLINVEYLPVDHVAPAGGDASGFTFIEGSN